MSKNKLEKDNSSKLKSKYWYPTKLLIPWNLPNYKQAYCNAHF